jgi:hypothetical protein
MESDCRAVLLAAPSDIVLNRQLDPTHTQIVYALRSGSQLVTLMLDLNSGKKTVLPLAGDDPRWLP